MRMLERATAAAKQYLENIGFRDVSLIEPSSLRGTLGGEVVVCFVRVAKEGEMTTFSYVSQAWKSRMKKKVSPDRYDLIVIRPLGKDRALLRHHAKVDILGQVRG